MSLPARPQDNSAPLQGQNQPSGLVASQLLQTQAGPISSRHEQQQNGPASLPPVQTQNHPTPSQPTQRGPAHSQLPGDGAARPEKRRRIYKCGLCGEHGHNRQKCPTKP